MTTKMTRIVKNQMFPLSNFKTRFVLVGFMCSLASFIDKGGLVRPHAILYLVLSR